MGAEYVVAYDVLSEGLRFGHFVGLIVAALMATVVGALFYCARNVDGAKFVFLGWALALCLCVGGCGGGNVLFQRVRCMNWARGGQFEVVEGEVRDFKPMPSTGHVREEFTVSGARFSYSDFDASTGGFNNSTSRGGPIREGLHVRISHHDGRILKIEVRTTSPH